MKKFLVVARAGDGSRHETWFQGRQEPNWDLLVSYYGSDPDRYKDRCLLRIDQKGAKFPAIAALLKNYAEILHSYDYVMFADDDLDSNTDDINLYFDLCARYGLELSQPSLSGNSHYSHPVTIVNPGFILRYTNFVEIMTPCFSRQFLLKCRDSFSENVSGWGLDYLWPTMASDEARVGVIDAMSVQHLRPIGGPMHGFFRTVGIDPKAEEKTLCLKHNLVANQGLAVGGVDRQGRAYRLGDDTHGEFIVQLVKGYLPIAANHGFDFTSLVEPSIRALPPARLPPAHRQRPT